MPRTEAGKRLVEMFKDSRRYTAATIADAIEAETVATERERITREVTERHAHAIAIAKDCDRLGNTTGADLWTARYIECAAILRIVNLKGDPR